MNGPHGAAAEVRSIFHNLRSETFGEFVGIYLGRGFASVPNLGLPCAVMFDFLYHFVELAGLEPATSCLPDTRSSQLSYSPSGLDTVLRNTMPSLVPAADSNRFPLGISLPGSETYGLDQG